MTTSAIYHGYRIDIMPITRRGRTRYHYRIWRKGEAGRIAEVGRATVEVAMNEAEKRVDELVKGGEG